ncbi:ISAs1 family transposase [Verrucosispora sp. WMMA2121]|uniref:ISAs1 family transposase n=1 Tax=Verrucosispora sp. WMMA2121 TaxID=3015164 RepID=UPI0022B636AD|nr:ISAs1 family transposase [Verrucosispora sp. WMMA2121]MCZ7421111.1 ISAs1 family transposase [Verrucosispora sp. WMMA2121]
MSSSLIDVIRHHAPAPPGSSTVGGEAFGLLEALERVPDPRDPRGVRYPLASVLAVAVCAVMAGACTFAAIVDWVDDLDAPAWGRLGFTGRVPVLSTVWRLLVRVDAETLTAVLADWLCSRVSAPSVRRVIAVDGKVVRGAVLTEGRVHLLSAYDTSTGVVLAQVQVAAKSNEIPAFAPLLEQVKVRLGGLAGVVIVADALHTQVAHARAVAAAGGDLYVSVKANQPTLYAQLKRLPWAQVPIGDQHRDTGHGRSETRTVKALTLQTPGGIGFPHAQQAVRITRTRMITGKRTRETVYLVASLPAAHAQPADLQQWARLEWHIENRLHWVRDVTFREDGHRARTGNGPAVAAVLRNTAIGFHRGNGETNIARATRRANRRPHDLITTVTSSYSTTQ